MNQTVSACLMRSDLSLKAALDALRTPRVC
jgi:hypothetical protein